MNPLALSCGCAAVATLASSAFPLQASEPHVQRYQGAPEHLGTIDPVTMRIEPAGSAGSRASVLDYDNGATNGFFFLPGPNVGVVDWGTYAPVGPGTLYEFTFGYATHALGPISLTLVLYSGTQGGCAPGDPGTVLGTFPLSGLPGSPDGIQTAAYTLTVDTGKSCIVVPAGALGWEYRVSDVATGPLLVDGPLGLPGPNGTEDAYDTYDLGMGSCVSRSFGGCLPPLLPCASFYMQLHADDGSTPWSAVVYGSGVNPAGSLIVSGGTARIGDTLVLGLDNPLGTQPAGSIGFLGVSLAPDPNFPAGTLINNFGMAAPGAPGELLISVFPPNLINPILGPSIWAGAGFPASFPLFIPKDTSLIGMHGYVQGLLWDFTQVSGIRFGLTEGVDVGIGF